jgi:CMP-N,N'-diacetyllegionaminic acid synthase
MIKKKKVLAIIPARGGSKRIPNKNIKVFLDKPLIFYAIKQALSCNFIDRVIVDTDSSEIAKISLGFGAEVPWLRPGRLAGNRSEIIDSILYNLQRLEIEQNYKPDHLIILQTTSPLREKKDIENCWRIMQKSKTDTVLTVCPTHPRLYYLDADNKLILANRFKKKSTNIQSWQPGYILNGCFVYIVKVSALFREKVIITKNTKAVICPRWRSVDLDNFEDWALAEFLYKNRKKIINRINQLHEEK